MSKTLLRRTTKVSLSKLKGRPTMKRKLVHRRGKKMRVPVSWQIQLAQIMKFLPEDDLVNAALANRLFNEMSSIGGQWTITIDTLDQLNNLTPFNEKYSVRHVIFSNRFNDDIPEGMIPANVSEITFGKNFNKPLNVGVLPNSLKNLTFGQSFDQPIGTGVLPSSLKSLTFGEYFGAFYGRLGSNALPMSIEFLAFSEYNPQIPLIDLPRSLKSLTIGNVSSEQPLELEDLPPTLEYLDFGNSFNQNIPSGSLPSSLKTLNFGTTFNKPFAIGSLPSELETLNLGKSSSYQHTIQLGVLPPSLKTLILHHRHTAKITVGQVEISKSYP